MRRVVEKQKDVPRRRRQPLDRPGRLAGSICLGVHCLLRERSDLGGVGWVWYLSPASAAETSTARAGTFRGSKTRTRHQMRTSRIHQALCGRLPPFPDTGALAIRDTGTLGCHKAVMATAIVPPCPGLPGWSCIMFPFFPLGAQVGTSRAQSIEPSPTLVYPSVSKTAIAAWHSPDQPS